MKNQEKNGNLQVSNQYNIQWFPGHMARTLRVMEQEIQHVDASLILLDARIPADHRPQAPAVRPEQG